MRTSSWWVLLVVVGCGGDDTLPEETGPIRIGQSAPTSGTNQGLGHEYKEGVEAAFAEQNAAGGIHGRELQLVFRDDQYDPSLALSNARELVDAQVSTAAPICPSTTTAMTSVAPISTTALTRGPNAVLALLGNVGTPSSVPAAAVAVETGTLYVGAATGTAVLLRDATAGACARYIFNVRASYAQEARATLELFQAKGITSYENLISFDQDDSYGQSGYDGLLAGYRDLYGSDPAGSIARFRYTRNDDTSVPAQAVAMEAYLAQRLQAQSGTVTVGIFMTDTYGAATTLIQHVRNWQYANDSQQTSLEKATRLKLYFSNMSFANADAMAERLVALGNVQTPSGLVPYTDGVLVSQVVPNFDEDTSDAIVAYKQRVSTPSYMSLEGYISARVLIAALLAHEGPFTSDGLRETLETAQLDIGLAGTFGFASDRQFSDTVWGTALQPNGKYRTLYSWRQGQAIDIAY